MPVIETSKAEVLVFTFKEGVFSAVAHDLKLRATRFRVDVDGETVKADFELSSLVVVSAMKAGRDDPHALSATSRAQIERNMMKDVLETRRFPIARFESTQVTPEAVEGRLTLHGVTRALRGTRSLPTVAEFRFDQRDFGIKPYSALLGTLKLQPQVLVRVTLPATAA
jgi:polyisoprenoid-binding protein YceI